MITRLWIRKNFQKICWAGYAIDVLETDPFVGKEKF